MPKPKERLKTMIAADPQNAEAILQAEEGNNETLIRAQQQYNEFMTNFSQLKEGEGHTWVINGVEITLQKQGEGMVLSAVKQQKETYYHLPNAIPSTHDIGGQIREFASY